MKPFESKLNKKEQKRNVNGFACVFSFCKTSLGQYPVNTAFNPFTNHALVEPLYSEEIFLPKEKLVNGLCNKVSFNLTFPSFPTLKYVQHTYKLQLVEVRDFLILIFQFLST